MMPLHIGHVRYLKEAKECGDILLVAVNSDSSVKKLKGESRPVVPENERAFLIAALEPVDFVVIFDEDTVRPVIGGVQPDIHWKGSEYAPPNGAPIPEAAVVCAYGGRIEFVSQPGMGSCFSVLLPQAGNPHHG